MIDINIEPNIQHEELVDFLNKIDNYFPDSLSINCKQPSLDVWASKLETTANFIIARNDKGKIVAGMIIYMNNINEYIYLNILAVIKEYRNNKLASQLLNILFEFAGRNRRVGVKLHCHKDNYKALNLYQNLGFRIIIDSKITNNYLLMEKDLL